VPAWRAVLESRGRAQCVIRHNDVSQPWAGGS